MTRFLVACALTGSLLTAVDDMLTFIASLRDPGPALASAVTMALKLTMARRAEADSHAIRGGGAVSTPCVDIGER